MAAIKDILLAIVSKGLNLAAWFMPLLMLALAYILSRRPDTAMATIFLLSLALALLAARHFLGWTIR